MLIQLRAMVRKDMQMFFSDRRAVIMSFVVPIAIASFFGSIFSGSGRNSEPARIAVAIVDEDGSAISNGWASSLTGAGPRVSRSSTARRVGSVRAWKTRPSSWLGICLSYEAADS